MINSKGYVENLYTPNCIRTVSGIYVNVFDPKPEMFELSDIAWALSRMQRFTAHLPTSFTILQHCLAVADLVGTEHKLAALLHDASEAYMHDIAGPQKVNFPDYKSVESGVMKVIAEKFGFEYPLHEDVKNADKEQLEWEWECIVIKGGDFCDGEQITRTNWKFKVGKFLKLKK